MKVLKVFRDKYNPERIYRPDEEFTCDDQERINDLISRGLIEGVSKPSCTHMTKRELMELLNEKGIEYNARATKDELIVLLGGD